MVKAIPVISDKKPLRGERMEVETLLNRPVHVMAMKNANCQSKEGKVALLTDAPSTIVAVHN